MKHQPRNSHHIHEAAVLCNGAIAHPLTLQQLLVLQANRCFLRVGGPEAMAEEILSGIFPLQHDVQ